VGTGFSKRSCSNNKLKRHDDSTSRHRALECDQVMASAFGLPPLRCYNAPSRAPFTGTPVSMKNKFPSGISAQCIMG
jgi:hypothetical protein